MVYPESDLDFGVPCMMLLAWHSSQSQACDGSCKISCQLRRTIGRYCIPSISGTDACGRLVVMNYFNNYKQRVVIVNL
jgi:hypothetical protein